MEIELLRLKERIEIAIELGESHYREFKTALEGRPEAKTPRDLKEIGVPQTRRKSCPIAPLRSRALAHGSRGG